MPARVLLVGMALTAAFAALSAPPPPRPAAAPAGVAAAPALDLTYQDMAMVASGCGMERWAVKTASDADRNLVSTTQHQTTIAGLRALPTPSSLPSNNRMRPTELTEYVIAGTLIKYASEGDSDIHLVIADAAGRTIIAEIPSTSCVTAARFKTEIGNTRRAFLARYTPASSLKTVHRAIRVRGIGFFDSRHGQSGVAPNGVELHPVLGLGFP